jgi:hypothetical protein
MTAATKAEAMALLESAWRDLDARFASLSDADLEREVFTGEGSGWRLRDLMPHFAFWWRLAARGARRATEIGAAPDKNTTLRAFVGVDTHWDTLNAPLLLVDGAETDGIRGYIWQPALNHLRQHAEHITAALGKEGAVT